MTHSDELGQAAIIAGLRAEANGVKQCFTTFAFQALVFSAAVLGAIAASADKLPGIHLAAAAVALLLIAVAKIGNYKYATANRIYGFELHHARLEHYRGTPHLSQAEAISEVAWEEAMRAWRVVQATVFARLYFYGPFAINFPRKPDRDPRLYIRVSSWFYRHGASLINRLRKEEPLPDPEPPTTEAPAPAQGANVEIGKKKAEPYRWYAPKELVGHGADYHAGSYLTSMLNIFYVFLVASFIPLVMFCVWVHNNMPHSAWPVVADIGTGLFAVYCGYSVLQIEVRRCMVESGILSIHSCAIMWEAVVVAHIRAVHASIKDHKNLRGYTEELGNQARRLVPDIHSIQDWVSATWESDPAQRERGWPR